MSRLGRVNHGISNLIVLLLVMRWQFDMVDHIFGVHGAALLNALVIAWMSQAAQRVLEARRGSYMYCSPRNARSWAVVVAGTAPWPIAEKLYETHPGWPLWQSMALPPAVRGAGVVLAVGLILARPKWGGEPQRQRTASALPELTVQPLLLMISMLLISGSPAVSLLNLYWLAVVLVGLKGAEYPVSSWPPLSTASNISAP